MTSGLQSCRELVVFFPNGTQCKYRFASRIELAELVATALVNDDEKILSLWNDTIQTLEAPGNATKAKNFFLDSGALLILSIVVSFFSPILLVMEGKIGYNKYIFITTLVGIIDAGLIAGAYFLDNAAVAAEVGWAYPSSKIPVWTRVSFPYGPGMYLLWACGIFKVLRIPFFTAVLLYSPAFLVVLGIVGYVTFEHSTETMEV
ncbi:hypothetical protein K440DRAFT_636221 [Wilcoxina mikolae CBS 423.85]|nr:hypothetical protein K440DRAFT_636221 [Wilcoxina mikolae CBS 423.85]